MTLSRPSDRSKQRDVYQGAIRRGDANVECAHGAVTHRRAARRDTSRVRVPTPNGIKGWGLTLQIEVRLINPRVDNGNQNSLAIHAFGMHFASAKQ